MTEAAAAHGELAVEVVCRCCGGERLQRTQRIVQHHPAQRLQITSVQDRTARRAVRVIARRPRDCHDFFIAARAFRELDHQVLRRTDADVNDVTNDGVADQGRRDRVPAWWQRQRERARRVGFREHRLMPRRAPRPAPAAGWSAHQRRGLRSLRSVRRRRWPTRTPTQEPSRCFASTSSCDTSFADRARRPSARAVPSRRWRM